MAAKKSWREKLSDNKGLPKIERIPEKMRGKWGQGTMVIPAPIEVDQEMKKIPKGRLITIHEIRKSLAKKHGTTICCPLTTGIFAWISANAAEEGRLKGEKTTTPYWRTLKSGGFLNEKYPGGAENSANILASEGFKVIKTGKQFQVQDFQKFIFEEKD